jgi:hypothetical protein
MITAARARLAAPDDAGWQITVDSPDRPSPIHQ